MKIAFLAMALSSAAFAYQARLYPHQNYIEMYNCDRGVSVTFNIWTVNKATARLSNFLLKGPAGNCPKIGANDRTFVLTREKMNGGFSWFGFNPDGTASIRVWDYTKGAGPNARPVAPFIVEEYDERGNSVQKLYPPTGARG